MWGRDELNLGRPKGAPTIATNAWLLLSSQLGAPATPAGQPDWLRETWSVETLYYIQPELHAKLSHNKYIQTVRIGGFRAKSYANDRVSGVVTVYFRCARRSLGKENGCNWVTNPIRVRLPSWHEV
jgi:hypothetical protein